MGPIQGPLGTECSLTPLQCLLCCQPPLQAPPRHLLQALALLQLRHPLLQARFSEEGDRPAFIVAAPDAAAGLAALRADGVQRVVVWSAPRSDREARVLDWLGTPDCVDRGVRVWELLPDPVSR